MTNLDDRLRAEIRATADEPDVIVLPRPTVAAPRRLWWRRYAIPALVALAVLVAVLVTGLLPHSGGSHHSATPGGVALLPAEIAGLSRLTANISDAPLGQPAIALLYQDGPSPTWGMSQVVVIGADGRTYRRLDLAERRGTLVGGGEWTYADTRLSPDGRRAAIGDPRGGSTEVPVLDLVTGERRDYPLPQPSLYRLVGWSPDGNTLALLIEPFATREPRYQGGVSDDASLTTINLATGALTTLGRAPGAGPDGRGEHHCFTGDGQSIAVAVNLGVAIHPLSGGAARTVSLPQGWQLGGCAPDGALLVGQLVGDGTRLRLISAADGSTLRELVLLHALNEVLAWRSPTTPVVFAPSGLGSGDGDERIVVAPFDAAAMILSTADEGSSSRIFRVDLADELAATAASTSAGPERGPWPSWARITAGATLTVVGAVVFLLFRRRRLISR